VWRRIIPVLANIDLIIIFSFVAFVIGAGIVYWYFTQPSRLSPMSKLLCPDPAIVKENGTSADGVGANEPNLLIHSFTSGDRSIYEKKVVVSLEFPEGVKRQFFAWGDAVIPVFGCITSQPPRMADVVNEVVTVEAVQGEKTIYKKSIGTDRFGTFNSSFYPPANGNIEITAKIANTNSNTTEETVSVIVTEAWAPVLWIFFLLFVAVILIVGFLNWYEKKPADKKQNQPKMRWSIVLVFIPVILAYIILYRFPPFDENANAAFATAMIAPIAAYIYKVMTES
jgi:hypothetical protein